MVVAMNYETLIVDGPYLAHRSYGAPYKLTTSNGRDSTMIHSFLRSLNSFRKQINPNKIIIAWESHGTKSWRKEKYPAYKGTKESVNPEFIMELEDLQKLLSLLKVSQYNSPCNEADDVIARLTISMNDLHIKYPIVIFTVDKDIMQLVGENLQIFNGKEFFNDDKVKEKFGVYPEHIPDLLAIAGDKADNIEGLNGYGVKKAAKIIEQFGNIENITLPMCSSNMDWSGYTKERIIRNKELTKLNFDCELKVIPNNVKESIDDILNKYELESIKEKLDEYKQLGGER